MFLNDAKKQGIKVIPPSVNKSKPYFYSNKKNEIIYGLSAIKNVGVKSAEILYKHRVKKSKIFYIFKKVYYRKVKFRFIIYNF